MLHPAKHCQRGELPPALDAQAQPMIPKPPNCSRSSLLVVDRDPVARALVAQIASQNFEVETAESAAAAQALFSGRPVDLILVDQHLPDMSGVQLLEWVR